MIVTSGGRSRPNGEDTELVNLTLTQDVAVILSSTPKREQLDGRIDESVQRI